MDLYVQLFMNSVQISAVYILFSLGLTMIFGVMKVVNFAHGEFFSTVLLLLSVAVPWLIGASLPLTLAYALSSVAALGVTLALGTFLYHFAFQRFQRDMIGSFVVSVGLSLLIQGVFLEIFGGAPRKLPTLIEGTVNILGGAITIERLILSAIAILVAAAMCVMIAHTKTGKSLRAVAEDHEAAMLQGIPYRKTALLGFLLATFLAAIGGVLVAPVSVITPVVGSDYLIRGFIAIVIGGLGSIPGSIIGAVLIAVIESVGGFYFDPSQATTAMFVIAILVLLIRPQGLMGKHG
jgi:branched-chain amino acid transport system permease protein